MQLFKNHDSVFIDLGKDAEPRFVGIDVFDFNFNNLVISDIPYIIENIPDGPLEEITSADFLNALQKQCQYYNQFCKTDLLHSFDCDCQYTWDIISFKLKNHIANKPKIKLNIRKKI